MARHASSSHAGNRHEGNPTDALFARERDVLALWDRGDAIDDIAAAVPGADVNFVERCVSYYDECRASEFAHAAMARRASAQLLAAIQRSGGRFA